MIFQNQIYRFWFNFVDLGYKQKVEFTFSLKMPIHQLSVKQIGSGDVQKYINLSKSNTGFVQSLVKFDD